MFSGNGLIPQIRKQWFDIIHLVYTQDEYALVASFFFFLHFTLVWEVGRAGRTKDIEYDTALGQ